MVHWFLRSDSHSNCAHWEGSGLAENKGGVPAAVPMPLGLTGIGTAAAARGHAAARVPLKPQVLLTFFSPFSRPSGTLGVEVRG